MSIFELESELVAAVDRLGPSVVRIDRGSPRGPHPSADTGATGSGVVWDATGLVVTNEHVVRGAAGVMVRFADGTTEPGTVVGSDPRTDIAAVHVARSDLVPAPRGDSSRLRVGQLAIAIGHALDLPGGPTASVGVVSGLNRPLLGGSYVLEGFLQTDAAINPGNSGGPLADLSGAVIGLNAAVAALAQGIGFAVPVNTVRSVVDALARRGRVDRGWLGVVGIPLDDATARRHSLARRRGVWLTEVVPGGPADGAGLKRGDIVIRIGSEGVRDLPDVVRALQRVRIGEGVDLAVVRDGVERRTILRVARAPDPPSVAPPPRGGRRSGSE